VALNHCVVGAFSRLVSPRTRREPFPRARRESSHTTAYGVSTINIWHLVAAPLFVIVTAATGCAASAAMPLTHRDHTQAVTFVTGHAKGDGEPDLDWQALARLKHTLVIYMGVARAETIRQRLIEAGLAPATPVAILENGTRPNEKIRRGQLQSLHAMVIEGQIKGPALIVIGTVAALARETLVETLERQAA